VSVPAEDRAASPYLTAKEAAAYLRYGSVAALYKAIPELNIPCLRRGGKTYLFHRDTLDRWLAGARLHRGRSVRSASR
jgi:excisionase family DNA binding protein